LNTFWGWREQQLADGTLILTSPAGRTYVTTPGSALLFPSLCRAVGGMPAPEADPPSDDYCAQRTAMMPTAPPNTDDDDPPPFGTEILVTPANTPPSQRLSLESAAA
jgi:hypothetical protein